MRVRFLSVLILLGMAVTAFAQVPEPPVRVHRHRSLPAPTQFSLELGTGYPPLHTLLLQNRSHVLSDVGQDASVGMSHFSVVSLSGVFRRNWRTEFVLTAGLSWVPFQITQYGTFGIDPDGNPRYDLDIVEDVWKESVYEPSLIVSCRHIFNPGGTVEWYSGLSLGLVYMNELTVLPGVTVIGLRWAGEHAYLFAENTYSPVATLVHGGLGWRF